MKEASIKVGNYVKKVETIDQAIDLRSKIFYFLMIGFGVFSLLYVLVLGNMVFNIIERKTVEVETRNALNEVADLEATYMTLVNNIDKNSPIALGLVEVKPTFAKRSNLVLVDQNALLALNEI
jgi:hypothetical protein